MVNPLSDEWEDGMKLQLNFEKTGAGSGLNF